MKRTSRLFAEGWWAAWLTASAAWYLFYGPLLGRGALLAFRDLPFFHLPLRTTLVEIAHGGFSPVWNASLHGGQPILSNPNYAAFYPPTWSALWLGAAASLSLGIAFHAAWGTAGMIRLVRRLGCRPPPAALAAVAWAGGGVVLSNASTYTLFAALAWWPWVVRWGLETLEETRPRRPVVAMAAGLTLQLLAGEPVVVLMSALVLGSLAVSATFKAERRLTPWTRLGMGALLAALLAAVQLIPTWSRVTLTERSSASFGGEALGWSAPPLRWVELLLPRFYGDPMGTEENLYFGWQLHDQSFPYIPSLYPGLLPVLLGLVALIRGKIPYRAVWWITIAVGLFLALGRHNPLFSALREQVPLLVWVRYPEKFVVPVVLCLVLAAVLGWQRLLGNSQDSLSEKHDARWYRLALGLGFALLGLIGALAVFLEAAPGLLKSFVTANGPPVPLSPRATATAVGYLQQQTWLAVATTGAAVGLLLLVRWRRCPAWLPAWLAPLLLMVDLAYTNGRFLRIGEAAEFLQPPSAVASVLEQPGRVFTDVELHPVGEIHFRTDGEPGFRQLRLRMERLDPYMGSVWGVRYAAHADYDRMLTPWARHVQTAVAADWWRDRERAYRFLGAWGVGPVLSRRTPEELIEARRADPRALPMRVDINQYRLPMVRAVPQVERYPDLGTALTAARNQGYPFPWWDTFVDPQAQGPPLVGVRPDFLRFAEDPGRINLHTLASGPLLLVVATTFDPGWQATLLGSNSQPVGVQLPLYPTAAGQIGLELPVGEHRVELRFHPQGLKTGAALSLLGLLIAAGLAFWRSPREPLP